MNSQIELDLQSRKIIKGIFDQCEILEPPTENKLILDLFKLKVEDLSKFITPSLIDTGTNIRALLARSRKTIFLHDHMGMQEKRKNFSIFHEIAHYVLPTHKKILNECSWRDLSPAAKKKLEIDANQFAADCIFQLDRFIEEANDSPLTLKTPFKMATSFNSSYEAAFRRYVEENPLPCALVVYKPETFDDEPDTLVVNYTVKSKSFHNFRYLLPNQTVGPGSIEREIFFDRSRDKDDFHRSKLFVNNPMTNKVTIFPAECFTNHYKVFQLVIPPDSKIQISE